MKMKCADLVIFLIFSIITGCATASFSKYPKATEQQTDKLYEDLAIANLKLGSTLEQIMSVYGDPQKLTRYKDKTLIIYRRPTYYDSVYLWFDADKELGSWSH